MDAMKAPKLMLGSLLLLLAGWTLGGCRWASGPGDTVDTPPRALVEKTFRPPAGAAQRVRPDQAGAAANPAAGTVTTK